MEWQWIEGNLGGRDRWVWEFDNAVFRKWEIGDGYFRGGDDWPYRAWLVDMM